MTAKTSVAFLGPEGTFAHLAAKRRFGTRIDLVPLPTIKEVFAYVCGDRHRMGVVPIENSSGGAIIDTVNGLVDENCPLSIQESLSVNVKLALLGKDKKSIRVIYSHFAPLHHCEDWLDDNFPDVKLCEEPSTAAAVKKAVQENGAAAIAAKTAAHRYKLKVLAYPIESSVPNVTQFFVLGHGTNVSNDCSRTSMVVSLPNTPGSLCDFLTPFKIEGVNLSRIVSRPIVGKPSGYIFLTDIEGTDKQERVRRALHRARATSLVRIIGVYPVRAPYDS